MNSSKVEEMIDEHLLQLRGRLEGLSFDLSALQYGAGPCYSGPFKNHQYNIVRERQLYLKLFSHIT